MTTNPYAPPAAPVDNVSSAAGLVANATPFFAVSLLKLGVLSICTLGLYELYWFYRNWQLIRSREQTNITPLLRAFFAVLFCYPCFGRIGQQGVSLGITPPLAAGVLATAWIITSITWKLPDPYWLISLLAVVFLLPVQAYVNRINEASAPGHDPNARFSAWNWLTVGVGGCLLVLAILGTFMAAQPTQG